MNKQEILSIVGMGIWMLAFVSHYIVATSLDSIVYAILTIPCIMMFIALYFTKSE